MFFLSSVAIEYPHFLFIDDSYDFWVYCSKKFYSFIILSLRDDPLRNVGSSTSFRLDLPRTACV